MRSFHTIPNMRVFASVFPAVFALISCKAEELPFPETGATDLNDYWFAKAEITRYELS